MTVRLVSVEIRVTAVHDDGETLHPLSLQPVVVTAAQWPDVVALVARSLEALPPPASPTVPAD
jgi:hypothetical protein